MTNLILGILTFLFFLLFGFLIGNFINLANESINNTYSNVEIVQCVNHKEWCQNYNTSLYELIYESKNNV